MTFEEAKLAAEEWARERVIGGRGRMVRTDVDPSQRVSVCEVSKSEWMEFWPNRDPRIAARYMGSSE